MNDEAPTITVEVRVEDAKCLCYGPLNAALAEKTEPIGSAKRLKQAVANELYRQGHRMRTAQEISDDLTATRKGND